MARKHHAPYVPTREDRALLGVFEGEVAALRTPRGALIARGGPQGAVMELVQGVYAAFPGRAHALLRGRILTSAPPRELDREVTRVAAKRLTAGVSPGERLDLPFLDLSSHARRARAHARRRSRVEPVDPLDLRRLTETLRADRPGRPLALQDRPVVAVLVSPGGEVLHAARNTAGRNRTLHAEINLVQGWWWRARSGLPDDSTVHVSLQPCRMCAAALAHAALGRLTVCYAEPDPGPFARDTALQRGGPVCERHTPRKWG